LSRIKVVGYGTFITRGIWKNKQKVEPCFVKGYKRILPPGNWFPFVLKCENNSFWALKFEINENELRELDFYEGVELGLFERQKIPIYLKNGKEDQAYIYLPTQKTINQFKLDLKCDDKDLWKEVIKKDKEIINRFPELAF